MTVAARDRNGDIAAARWVFSAAIVAACHAAAVALGFLYAAMPLVPGAPTPAVLIDMTSAVPAAPPSQQDDVAPGPDMQQAEAARSEPAAPPAQETPAAQLLPTPMQEHAEVAAPLESRPATDPAKPTEARIAPQKPVQAKIKPSQAPQKQTASKPAPRTTATPRASRQAANVSGAVTGASFATASYNQLVAAHLQRFKQYPAAARAAGQQGVARVAFTLSRSGQVLGSSLAGSSGAAALDAETVAMVRRAAPFPPMPPDIHQASMRFVVPVSFMAR